MNAFKKFLLKKLANKSKQNKTTGGFTLIELLVAMILTFLIITPLMTLVITLMDNDRKEEAKSTSQQEIQVALDYIAQDLQQAVYIYDANALQTGTTNLANATLSGIKNQIPPNVDAVATGCAVGKCVPVLAFWKRKYLDRSDTIGGKTISAIDDVSKGSDRFVYSLVVYYLIKDDATAATDGWSNTARIGRWEVRDGICDPASTPKNDGSCSTYLLDPDKGFVGFITNTTAGSLAQRMNSWKKDTTSYTQKVTILIDYIDDTSLSSITDITVKPQFTPPTNDLTAAPIASTKCSDEKTGLDKDGKKGSSLVPPDTIDTLKTGSFYACVNPINAQGQSVAQVFIRGNALRRLNPNDPNKPNSYNINYFPLSSVRVAVRGLAGQ